MSQTWTEDVYAQSHTGATDLQNMENNFQCLKSLFSGGSSPSNAVAGMPWFDTTDKLLKIRNQANSAWLGVMYGNSSTPIWMYVDAAPDGWAVAGSLTDRIIAIKGGTQAYNVAGGNTGGTWTQPNHTLTTTQMPSHTHTGTTDSDSHNHTFGGSTPRYGSGGSEGSYGSIMGGGSWTGNLAVTINNDAHTHKFTSNSRGGGGAHNHGITYRPAAAVGILVAPDVT